jgi:hypothetical protein
VIVSPAFEPPTVVAGRDDIAVVGDPHRRPNNYLTQCNKFGETQRGKIKLSGSLTRMLISRRSVPKSLGLVILLNLGSFGLARRHPVCNFPATSCAEGRWY